MSEKMFTWHVSDKKDKVARGRKLNLDHEEFYVIYLPKRPETAPNTFFFVFKSLISTFNTTFCRFKKRNPLIKTQRIWEN